MILDLVTSPILKGFTGEEEDAKSKLGGLIFDAILPLSLDRVAIVIGSSTYQAKVKDLVSINTFCWNTLSLIFKETVMKAMLDLTSALDKMVGEDGLLVLNIQPVMCREDFEPLVSLVLFPEEIPIIKTMHEFSDGNDTLQDQAKLYLDDQTDVYGEDSRINRMLERRMLGQRLYLIEEVFEGDNND